MVCKVSVWAHDYSGTKATFEGEGYHNVQSVSTQNPGRPYRFGYQKATTATGYADESCMMVGYTWHGGGWYHNGKQENGDMFMFPNGGYDLRYAKGQESRGFNDNLDGLQIKTVPSANSSQMQYNINIPVQEPHNFSNPILIEDDNGKVKDDNGTKFNPCPGASAKYFNSKPGVRCIYPKTASALQTLHGATKKSNMAAMHTSLAGTFCSDSNKVFESPGGQSCLERSTGAALAKTYCQVGSKIKSDENCTKENMGEANYDAVAKAFCEANPNDSFCSCYNVVENKCANDKKTGVKGCAETSEYVDLRNATPSEFQSVWDGQRKCGSICTGANKYIPDNNQAGCKTTIQICAQDINVGSMSESDIKASCELNASDGSSAGEPPAPSPAQDSAKSELDEAKAALVRGDAGAQERVDAAEAALAAADESAGETGPKAYIPKSLDGLKNDRKQQIGAGVMGALVLGCMMMLLLIVASASGGGGGPAKRRFR